MRTEADRGNTMCIVGNADALTLVLHVDRDTYQQFGLSGSRSGFRESRDSLRRIFVELSSDAYMRKGRIYERVQWCLQNRVNDAKVVIASEKAPVIPENSRGKVTQVSPEFHRHLTNDLRIPSAFSTNTQQSKEELQALHDILALLNMRLPLPHEGDTHSLFDVAVSQCLDEEAAKCGVLCQQARTFLNGSQQLDLFNKAVQLLRDRDLPWMALSFWGVSDAPLSFYRTSLPFSAQEHAGGDQIVTLLVRRDMSYVSFVALSGRDTFAE
ncbi:MAG: hypothetical protein MHM6MM_000235 [Cercozoa sp. M6MM]